MDELNSKLSFPVKLLICISLTVFLTLPSCLEEKLHQMEVERLQQKIEQLEAEHPQLSESK